MTPEQIQRMETLEKKLAMLENSALIPRNVETALKERLNIPIIAAGTLVASNTAGITGPTVYNAFPVTVPAAPSGSLQVTYAGATYFLLYR